MDFSTIVGTHRIDAIYLYLLIRNSTGTGTVTWKCYFTVRESTVIVKKIMFWDAGNTNWTFLEWCLCVSTVHAAWVRFLKCYT